MRVIRLITSVVLGLAVTLTLAAPVAAQAKNKSSDLLTPGQVKELTASAKTPADHLKLARHYTALAAKYDAESAEHAAIADIERKSSNASESKRPGAPGTALHCDRLADNLRVAATEARAMAADHEAMAKSVK
jgi:hypothetical protein